AGELRGRDLADAAVETGLFEDRPRELGPRALALRREVPDAVRSVQQLTRRLGEMTDVGGAADLVCDHRHLVPFAGELEHGPDEVLARPAEEPRAADDPAFPHFALALELRAAVDRERVRLVRFD